MRKSVLCHQILGGLTILFVLAGCAPACRIEFRPPDGRPVVLNRAETCFSREGDSFRLLAAVPSRPDMLSLLSPDGGTPAYYFELTLSGPGREQTAEVRVFIEIRHAPGFFGGTAYLIQSRERDNVVFVRCRVLLKPVPGYAFAGHGLLDGADLHIDGEFRFNPKTYDRLNTKMQALMKWFDELYKPGHATEWHEDKP